MRLVISDTGPVNYLVLLNNNVGATRGAASALPILAQAWFAFQVRGQPGRLSGPEIEQIDSRCHTIEFMTQ